MNTAYFDNIVTRANNLTAHINKYTQEANTVIEAASNCTTLAILAASTVEQLLLTTDQAAEITTQADTATTEIQNGITAGIALLAPLIVAPTNLTTVITWAAAVTETYLGPYNKYIANAAIVATEITRIAAALEALTAAIATATTTLDNAIANRKNLIGC